MVLNTKVFEQSPYRAKDRDKAFVYERIFESSGLSQKSLLERHGIRPTALSKAIQELLSDGLIHQTGRRTGGKQGRPELLFSAVYDRLVGYAIYVESREHYAVVVDLQGRVLFETSRTLHRQADNRELQLLYNGFIETLKQNTPGDSEVVGVGISTAGNVHPETKTWVESDRWPTVKDFSFEQLEARYGVPISVGRDLDDALKHQLNRHPEYQRGSTVLLHWGGGIGFAYSNEGRILGSRHGRFGTIGHTFVIHDGPNGGWESFEARASIRAVLHRVQTHLPGLPEDERAFAAALKKYSLENEPAVREAISFMARCILNLWVLLYPDRILFVGPFAEHEPILRRLREEVASVDPQLSIGRYTELLAVEQGYRGSLYGSTYELFRNGLRSYLRARY